MTFNSCARIAGALLASSAIVAAANVAYANGQGTPVEPAPMPAPTVLEPAGPAMAPAPAPMMKSNWSGLYIGGHLGYGWAADNEDEVFSFDTNRDGVYGDTVFTAPPNSVNAFGPGFCGGKATSTSPATGCDDDKGGFDGGIRLGYDYDLGGFILGGVIEGSFADVSDSVSGFSTTPASYTFTRDLNYLLAARLRAGFAFDSVLLYATGGYAYGDVDHTFTTTNGANSFTGVNDDGLSGYQIGGGAEYMLSDSLSFGVEYIYTSLDDSDYLVAVGPGTAGPTNPFLQANATGTDIKRSEDRFDIHSVRATMAYHFGGM